MAPTTQLNLTEKGKAGEMPKQCLTETLAEISLGQSRMDQPGSLPAYHKKLSYIAPVPGHGYTRDMSPPHPMSSSVKFMPVS